MSGDGEIWPVILAGGSGTRLWPLSRMEYPKQLLRLGGSSSLLQETLLRLRGLDAGGDERFATRLGRLVLVCNQEHRYFVAQQVDTLGGRPGESVQVVLEPFGRNTAPALTVAARIAVDDGADPILLVLAADHFISDVEAFHAAVRVGARLAAGGGVGTFGIVPTHAETGFGYIRTGTPLADGALAIDAFVEKPDAGTAQAYVDSGGYLWNSGMFVTRASTWLAALERFRPDIAQACAAALPGTDTGGREVRLDAEAFEACPSDSIDYAVMEPLASSAAAGGGAGAFVVPLDAGWSDVGSWSALLDVGERDADGNVTAGDVFCHGTRDTLVLSHHRLVATLGLDGVVVVETPDAVLVADREHTQDVRHVVEWLNATDRVEARAHRRVYCPWGSAEWLTADAGTQILRLAVNPGARLRPRRGLRHREQWLVVRGTAAASLAGVDRVLEAGDSLTVPEGVTHGLANPSDEALEMVVTRLGKDVRDDVAWEGE